VGGLLEASGYVNLERSNRSYRDAAGQVQLYDYLAPALAIGSRDHRLLAPLRRYFGGELVWSPKSTRRSGACRWRVTNRRQLEQLAEHCGQLPLVGPKVQRLILLPEFYRLREAGAYRTDSLLQPRWEELRRFFGVTRTGEPKKAPESRSLQSRSGSPKKAEASKETPKAALAKPDPALKPESELRPEPGSAAERAQLLCSLGEWGSLELPERPQRRSGNQSSRKPDHFRCPEPRLILESPTPQLPEALQRHFGGRVLGSVRRGGWCWQLSGRGGLEHLLGLWGPSSSESALRRRLALLPEFYQLRRSWAHWSSGSLHPRWLALLEQLEQEPPGE
jgi:hypothetical protein